MHLDTPAFNYDHKIINGTAIADALLDQVKSDFLSLPIAEDPPGMAFIRVGEDPASVTYVNKKNKVAQSLGIRSELYTFPITASESHVVDCIQKLNADSKIHAILVQAPLPYTWNATKIFNSIHPDKDVDGFTTHNLGKLLQGHTDGLVPCTPLGILYLLEALNCKPSGKHIVVIGRSLTVGRPLSVLLSQKRAAGDATVSVCHSGSCHIERLTRIADIIIVAVGRPNFLTADMVQPGAIVIDVGINRISDAIDKRGYKLVGDCAFEALLPIVSNITPVPGGVGPLTVASLMLNILQVYKAFHSYK